MRPRPLLLIALLAAACSEPGLSPADAAAPDVPRDLPDVADLADVADVAAPDVGACGARPLGSRTGAPVVTGTTRGAGALAGSCGGAGAPEAAFSWTAPRAGTYRLHTGGASYNTVLYVRDGACEGAEVACNDDAEKTFQSRASVTLRAGQTVVIVVDGADGGAGAFELSIEEVADAPDAG
jgi:hypothetical protein